MSKSGRSPGKKRSFDGRFAELERSLRKSTDYETEIARFRRDCPESELMKYAHMLADSAMYRKAAIGEPFPKVLSDLPSSYTRTVLPLNRELRWLACELRLFARELSGFHTLERQYEAALISHDFSRARALLMEITSTFGASLWATEQEICLREASEGLEAQKLFLRDLLRQPDVDPLIKIIIYGASWRVERAMSPDRYQVTLRNAYPYTFDGDDGLGQYLAFHLNFFGSVRFSRFADILCLHRNLSIIDRYLCFLRIAQLIVADPRSLHAKSLLTGPLELLGSRIDDSRLKNLVLVLGMDSPAIGIVPDKRLIEALDYYTAWNDPDFPDTKVG